MCIICVDFQKDLLTTDEVRRNMGEMVISDEHREEIERLIEDRELVEKITDAPARYSYYVDASGVSPKEVEAYLRGVKKQMARNPPSPLDSCD